MSETFFAPCPRGLEPVLAAELAALGAGDVAASDAGVRFTGPFDLCEVANLGSRVASRILWQVWTGPYRNEQDVYDAARGLPWPDWFAVERTMLVRVDAVRCPLRSLDFVTLRIKDAVCDAFRERTGARPSIDTVTPDLRVHAFLDAQTLTLYLDTSGPALFRRGERPGEAPAPLKKNLAAGILGLVGYTGSETLLDPMCGSGTLLVEAAQIARDIAPGLGRGFAFEHITGFDAKRWAQRQEAARARVLPRAPLPIHGSDLYGSVLDGARANLQSGGLADDVVLKQANILELRAPAESGVIVTNPPYGTRVGELDALAAFYPMLGDTLKRSFPGWRAFILSADMRLPKLIGLAVSRRTPLFNGALECRLFEYRMVAGSMRRKPAAE